MEDEDVKVSQGLLLIRTKSGTTKLEKVLVHAKRGEGKNQVKWLQKYVKERKSPSKIPVFVKNYRRGIRSKKILKSSAPSAANIKKKDRACAKPGEDLKTKKCRNLNAEERRNLLSIINLDNSKSDKFLQRQNEDSGIISASQTSELSHKHHKEAPNGNKVEKSEASPSDITEETESSKKKVNFSDDISKSNTSANETSSAILDETDFSQNKSTTSEETPKKIAYNSNVILAENQMYTIQFPVSEDDGNERVRAHPQRLRTSIVMSQYQSTSNQHDSSDDESSEELQYIDSGLRPLRSDQSKLFIRASAHKATKHHTTSDDDEVRPLLEDLPSDIFDEWLTVKKKKKKPKEIVKQPSVPSHKGDFTSSEDKSISSQPSNQIDTEPLKKLQEFEDVKFTIETEEIDEEEEEPEEVVKREDICVHIKDMPDGDYSSSTVEDLKSIKEDEEEEYGVCHCNDVSESSLSVGVDATTKSKEKKSTFSKKDFCVHTTDLPGHESFSTNSSPSSELSITGFRKHAKVIRLKENSEPKATHKSVGVIHSAKYSSSTRLYKSASSSYSTATLAQHSHGNSILLESNKERRASKYHISDSQVFSQSDLIQQ